MLAKFFLTLTSLAGLATAAATSQDDLSAVAIPNAPGLTYLYSMNCTLGEVVNVGATPNGNRIVIPIVGGTFSGPRMSGKCGPLPCSEYLADLMLEQGPSSIWAPTGLLPAMTAASLSTRAISYAPTTAPTSSSRPTAPRSLMAPCIFVYASRRVTQTTSGSTAPSALVSLGPERDMCLLMPGPLSRPRRNGVGDSCVQEIQD